MIRFNRLKHLLNITGKWLRNHRPVRMLTLVTRAVEKAAGGKPVCVAVPVGVSARLDPDRPADLDTLTNVPKSRVFADSGPDNHEVGYDIESAQPTTRDDPAGEFSVPGTTLEKWLSAGFLSPQETRMVEKMIKQKRNKIVPRPVGNW